MAATASSSRREDSQMRNTRHPRPFKSLLIFLSRARFRRIFSSQYALFDLGTRFFWGYRAKNRRRQTLQLAIWETRSRVSRATCYLCAIP